MRMVSLRLFICTILIMLLFISSSVLHAEDEIISEETVLTDDIYVEEVFARDENPAESNNKHNKKKKVRDEVISLKGNYLLPKTNLESVLENGKGFSAQYSFKDILIPNMSAGICFQFIHFNGKKDYIDSFIFIPVLADLSYSYSLNFAFDIEAHISAGFTYNILNYSETEVDSKTGEYSTHSGFEPLLRAGFLIAYKFSEKYKHDNYLKLSNFKSYRKNSE